MCGGSLRRLDTFGRQRSTFGTRLRVLTAATGSAALAAAKFKQLLLKGNPEVAAISSGEGVGVSARHRSAFHAS